MDVFSLTSNQFALRCLFQVLSGRTVYGNGADTRSIKARRREPHRRFCGYRHPRHPSTAKAVAIAPAFAGLHATRAHLVSRGRRSARRADNSSRRPNRADRRRNHGRRQRSASAFLSPARRSASDGVLNWCHSPTACHLDVRSAIAHQRITLAEQISQAVDALAIDPTGENVFLITDHGLTIVALNGAPLSVGSVTPASAAAEPPSRYAAAHLFKAQPRA